MKLIKHLLPSNIINSTLFPPGLSIIPIITIKGNQQFVIENDYTLLSFSEKYIKLDYQQGHIEITGDKLKIKAMFPEEMILQGTIKQIIFIS